MDKDEFDPKMLEVLVCPLTQGRLELSSDRSELICPASKIAFPIRSGVPILLASEARDLTEAERAKAKSRPKR